MQTESRPSCRGTVYIPRVDGTDPRPCKNDAITLGGYCFAHDPQTLAERDAKYTRDALQRKRKRELHQRKLLLIPLLDLAKKSRRKLDGPRAKMGATVIINILEFGLREEE